jgi:hypothetical protein
MSHRLCDSASCAQHFVGFLAVLEQAVAGGARCRMSRSRRAPVAGAASRRLRRPASRCRRSSFLRSWRLWVGSNSLTSAASLSRAPISPAVSIQSMRRPAARAPFPWPSCGRRKMREDALADVLGLADIERQIVFAVEEVDAGRVGQVIDDAGIEMRRQAGVGVLRPAARLRYPQCCGRREFFARTGWISCASASARWRASACRPWRSIRLSRLCRWCSGKQGARQLDGAQTEARKVMPRRLNSFFRKP